MATGCDPMSHPRLAVYYRCGMVTTRAITEPDTISFLSLLHHPTIHAGVYPYTITCTDSRLVQTPPVTGILKVVLDLKRHLLSHSNTLL